MLLRGLGNLLPLGLRRRAFVSSAVSPDRASRRRGGDAGADEPPAMPYTENPTYAPWDPRHAYHLVREASSGLVWLLSNYHRREERAAREKRELAEKIMRGVEQQTKAEEDFLIAVRAKAMDELEELRTETRGRSDRLLRHAREGAKVPGAQGSTGFKSSSPSANDDIGVAAVTG